MLVNFGEIVFVFFVATLGEEGVIRERSPSPPRHPVNRIIHIRCLTRPFTQKALHDLVGKFGSFDKNEFWIDGIKSHCFIKVRYCNCLLLLMWYNFLFCSTIRRRARRRLGINWIMQNGRVQILTYLELTFPIKMM